MSIISILDGRTMSSFPISIGTAITLESIFDPMTAPYDPDRPIPNKVDINRYGVHYFNLYTIIRNIISAVPQTMQREQLLASLQVVDAITSIVYGEVEIMLDLYSRTKCKLNFYVPDYTKIAKAHDNFITLSSMSKGRASLDTVYDAVAKKVIKETNIISGSNKLPRTNAKTLITTHSALDLLNVNHIFDLELIESHTGRLKKKNEFNTKYHKLGKLPVNVFPFTEKLLYILGDRNTYIKAVSFKLRGLLYTLAVENKWTAFTTKDKVTTDIKKVPELYELYMKLKTFY